VGGQAGQVAGLSEYQPDRELYLPRQIDMALDHPSRPVAKTGIRRGELRMIEQIAHY
jgi:hypothetical protein